MQMLKKLMTHVLYVFKKESRNLFIFNAHTKYVTIVLIFYIIIIKLKDVQYVNI